MNNQANAEFFSVINAVKEGDNSGFSIVISMVDSLLKASAHRWMRTPAVKVDHDFDDLYNLFLTKTWECCQKFKFDEEKTEEVNFKKFIGFLSSSIRNFGCDIVYNQGAEKRSGNVVSIHSENSDGEHYIDIPYCDSSSEDNSFFRDFMQKLSKHQRFILICAAKKIDPALVQDKLGISAVKYHSTVKKIKELALTHA